uniref:Uncharacterized protein n=1 Tax=Rhizophora mucronata TaxID=61149 RepID=A0A2P2R2C3_RHIMU
MLVALFLLHARKSIGVIKLLQSHISALYMCSLIEVNL